MGPLSLLLHDPAGFVLLAIPLLYSIILHEVAHGLMAERMGDPTARWMGRITLDPRRHLDPLGTVMLVAFGFGWAKPVPVNFHNVRDLRKGLIWISAAGPLTNFALALSCLLLLRHLPPGKLQAVLWVAFRVNVMLAAFNLIPIPPLDGSRILMGLSGRELGYALARLEPYGFLIIVAMLALGLLDPLVRLFEGALLGIIRALLGA